MPLVLMPPSDSSPRIKPEKWAWRALHRHLLLMWKGSSGWGRATLAVEAGLALVALFQIAQIAFVFALRLRYPFELEWMEGGMLDHVRVLLSGEPLYREPSLAFTPYIYTPLYYAVSAAFCRLLGVGLLGPRLVSVLAATASVVLIADFVRRESRDTLAALVAGAWFIATYRLTGLWLDIARVDALLLSLVLASVWLARFGRSFLAAAGAGIALSLAFFTKQSAVVFLAPVVAFTFARGWRRALTSASAFVIPTVLAVAWANHVSGGWFSYYVFRVPGQHAMLWNRWRPLLVDFFLVPVSVPLLSSIWLFLRRPAFLQARFRLAAYGVLLLASAASSYSGLLHRDGFVNVLIPHYAMLAVVAGLGFAALRASQRETRGSTDARQSMLTALACLLALAALEPTPAVGLPTHADRQAGSHMLDILRAQPDPMLALGSGYAAFRAGHQRIHAQAMALADVLKTREPEPKGHLLHSLIASIQSRQWASIVLDPSYRLLPPVVQEAVRRNYRLKTSVFSKTSRDALWPKTGFRCRPQEVWVPR